MAWDEIPLPDVLSAGGDYLSRLRDTVGDGTRCPPSSTGPGSTPNCAWP
ncbi:hypothetical protein NKH18_27545 [Streptomyces sp. M10(2022)]